METLKTIAALMAAAGLLLVGLALYADRYEMVAAGTGGDPGHVWAYRLDKRTGEVVGFVRDKRVTQWIDLP